MPFLLLNSAIPLFFLTALLPGLLLAQDATEGDLDFSDKPFCAGEPEQPPVDLPPWGKYDRLKLDGKTTETAETNCDCEEEGELVPLGIQSRCRYGCQVRKYPKRRLDAIWVQQCPAHPTEENSLCEKLESHLVTDYYDCRTRQEDGECEVIPRRPKGPEDHSHSTCRICKRWIFIESGTGHDTHLTDLRGEPYFIKDTPSPYGTWVLVASCVPFIGRYDRSKAEIAEKEIEEMQKEDAALYCHRVSEAGEEVLPCDYDPNSTNRSSTSHCSGRCIKRVRSPEKQCEPVDIPFAQCDECDSVDEEPVKDSTKTSGTRSDFEAAETTEEATPSQASPSRAQSQELSLEP
ncbi:hypothetical protein MRY87_12220 [bacterium]|nr:hypothetical protein [bacterium]